MTKNIYKLQEKRDAELKRVEVIVKIAHRLFVQKGYEKVGIREISAAANLSPAQLYRLGLDKQDLLAEVILRINAKQISEISPFNPKKHPSAKESIESYLLALYEKDISMKAIRAEGAAFGWKWSGKYEARIIDQLMQIIKPIADALAHDGFDDIQARCFAIWSLYYVGYRNAVMNDADAQQCLDDINPSLALLLRK